LKAKLCIVTFADDGAGCGKDVGAGLTVGVALGAGVGVTLASGVGVAVGDEHPARSVATVTNASIVNKAVLVYTFRSQYHIISGLL
jgi:hypothetical protein